MCLELRRLLFRAIRRRTPRRLIPRRTSSSTGFPHTGINGLGNTVVYGAKRVPSPPARMTARVGTPGLLKCDTFLPSSPGLRAATGGSLRLDERHPRATLGASNQANARHWHPRATPLPRYAPAAPEPCPERYEARVRPRALPRQRAPERCTTFRFRDSPPFRSSLGAPQAA